MIGWLPTYILRVVRENFERFVFSQTVEEKCLWAMMMDDVNVNRRVRPSSYESAVGGFAALGLCRCASTQNVSTLVKSYDDLVAIKEAMETSSCGMLADEMTAVFIAPNRRHANSPRLLLASGTCKKGDQSSEISLVINTISNVWTTDPRGEKMRGPMPAVWADGAGTFVKGSHAALEKQPLPATHALHPQISQMILFNDFYSCSSNAVAVSGGSEQKHTVKRTKEAIKSEKRTYGVHGDKGPKMDGTLLRAIITDLHEIGSPSSRWNLVDVAIMFKSGFADAQNVPACVLLMRAIVSLSDRTSDNFPMYSARPLAFKAIKPTLDILSRYFGCLLVMLTKKDCTVNYHLGNLAELAFLAFALWRRNGTSFIPAQNYRNTQSMIKTIYTSVLTAIDHKIMSYFLYQDADDRVEVAFGILRSLFTGANMDCNEFEDRATAMMVIDQIFVRRPELHSGSRHLNVPCADGIATTDHMNAELYLRVEGTRLGDEGCFDLTRIDLSTCNPVRAWNSAAARVANFLADRDFTREEVNFVSIARTPNVDMLRPQGTWVGVKETDDDVAGASRRDVDADDDCGALERELAPPPDRVGEEQPTPRRIAIPGHEGDFHIEAAFKNIFSGVALKKSVDRNRRVMNMPASGAEGALAIAASNNEEDEADEAIPLLHCHVDPLIVAVHSGSFVTLAVVVPIKVKLVDNTYHLTVPLSHLKEPGTSLTANVMMLRHVDEEDENLLVWNGKGFSGVIEFDAACCDVIDPKVTRLEKHGIAYSFKVTL
jgi:hypothetical protein